jgi:predicted alpha/beta hydrolase family esterase
MKKPKRIVDINGTIINEPQHYHESLKWAREMVQEMENDNVDRSDMQVVIERLSEEVRFTLLMLRDRDV